MASNLINNIVNQTLQNSFFESNIFEDGYAGIRINQTASNLYQQTAVAGNNPAILSETAIIQADREDAILSGGVSPEEQLESLTQLQAQFVEMSQYERMFWVLLFSIMVLIAAGGNTIVVYIVSTNKEMKSVTNYFLVNLSLADTMVSTLNVVFNFISMLISHWPFGKMYCKISNFIAILSISASVFTLTAISCDRYNAIIHPLRPRMSHSLALAWILLIWTLSGLLAIPNAIYSTLVEDKLTNDNVAVTCTMIWPDGRYPLSSHDHIYNIVILVLTYLVPIITMAILYYRVGKELWGYEAIGENIDIQQRSIMAKKKIVKMMIVVVIIFALCWLPYHAFFVVNYYVPTIFQDVPLNYQRCYLIMYWMAMSNSMYNPIIIYFMNSKFRLEFRKILCLLCCCRVYIPPTRSNNEIANNHNQPNHLAANRSSFRAQTNKRQVNNSTNQQQQNCRQAAVNRGKAPSSNEVTSGQTRQSAQAATCQQEARGTDLSTGSNLGESEPFISNHIDGCESKDPSDKLISFHSATSANSSNNNQNAALKVWI